MPNTISIPYKEKLLIYLRNYLDCKEGGIFPKEVTQEGIAEGVDMSRTHVSRVVQGLIDEGLLKEHLANVKGSGRKLKTYTLTMKGIRAAEDIISQLEDTDITMIKRGKKYVLPITDVKDKSDGKIDLLKAINIMESSKDVLDLDILGPKDPVKMLDQGPEIKKLYGRGRLLSDIDSWLQGEVPIIVMFGSRGAGTSSIARRYLDSVKDRHLLWIRIKGMDRKYIEEKFTEFIERIGDCGKGDVLENLRSTRALVVLDDYHHVKDDIVDMMAEILDSLKKDDNLKIIVTAREGTPVYERFYHRDHMEKGKVMELKVNTLGEEEAQKILGGPIDPEALKRIMLMTKGSPLLLKLLKEEDIDGMNNACPLTRGQISLLIYLKDQKLEG